MAGAAATEKKQPDNLDNLDRMAEEVEKQNAAIEGEVETEKDRQDQKSAEDEAAKAGAAMAVAFAETMLKMRWAFVDVPAPVRASVVEKAVPVVRKYGGDLPAWLLPYRAEVELGIVLAVAGIGIYAQVAEHNARQAQAEQAKQAAEGAGDAVQTDQSEHSMAQ